MPSVFSKLKKLQVFSTVPFFAEPETLLTLTDLRILHVASNSSLVRFPDGMSSLSELHDVSIRSCSSFDGLDSICSVSSLKTLLISDCPLDSGVPEGIGGLRRLAHLTLDHTGIEALPNSIRRLKHLTALELSSSSALSYIPEGISALRGLEVLNLKNCGALTELTEGIGSLTNLTRIELAGCTGLERFCHGGCIINLK